MIVDFNVETARLDDRVYDVAISGGGPAGITLALALAAAGKQVALIEGGGVEYDERSQSSYAGTLTGAPYAPLDTTRLRFLGGSSNHWSGRCGALDPIDFQPRQNRLLPGWPISRDEVYRFGAHARRVLDLPAEPFRPDRRAPLPSRHFRYSDYAMSPPTRFLTKYQAALRASRAIDCYLHANLVNIAADTSGRHIRSFSVRNYRGIRGTLRARRYVVAHGGIENARALLNADDVVKTGLGNAAGLAGRCFMEHLDVRIGNFVITDDSFWASGGLVTFNAGEALVRRHQISSGLLAMTPSLAPTYYGRAAFLRRLVSGPGCRLNPELTRRMIGADCPGDSIVTSMIEQIANPASRVTLIHDRDGLGLRRINLNWAIHRHDLRTIELLARELGRDLARMNIARLQIAPAVLNHGVTAFGVHSHHMGTTRMSADPRHGVVDPQSRVHGIDNLYMAGSSVFPTGGAVNPTFTIVALALRLADHLKRLR